MEIKRITVFFYVILSILITNEALILAYLLTCAEGTSICSEALRVWSHFLENTFGLKRSLCNFLLLFSFSVANSLGCSLTVLFVSVRQPELLFMWHVLYKRNYTMWFRPLRHMYGNVTQHCRRSQCCTAASGECLQCMLGFSCGSCFLF